MTKISPEAARTDHETLRAILRLTRKGERATAQTLSERVSATHTEIRLALRRLRSAGLVEIFSYDARLTMLGMAIAAALLPRASAVTARARKAA